MTQIKKLLLYISVIVFAICSKSWAEERWTPIYEDKEFTMYIDEESIIKVGDYYFVWELMSYHEVQQEVTLPLDYYIFKGTSNVTLWKFDCEEWMHTEIIEYIFSGFMGTGIHLDVTDYTHPNYNNNWEGVVAESDSPMYRITKRICE